MIDIYDCHRNKVIEIREREKEHRRQTRRQRKRIKIEGRTDRRKEQNDKYRQREKDTDGRIKAGKADIEKQHTERIYIDKTRSVKTQTCRRNLHRKSRIEKVRTEMKHRHKEEIENNKKQR